MASENVLQVIDLCKSFHKLEVLKNISVTFKKNEVVSIIGPSGGGMHADNEYGHSWQVKNCAEIYRRTVAALLCP